MDITEIRQDFPGLKQDQVFLDNAGGTQALGSVIDSISSYITLNNAQIGASYPTSVASTKLIEDGWTAAASYINAGRDEIIIGASTTQLLRNLSTSLFEYIDKGDEIIVSKLDHEANMAPWVQLAKDRGALLKWYESKDKTNPQIDCESLSKLMTSRTKLFACTHVSNVLGTINDVKAIAKTVHQIPGALFCVDGVAFAPHRAVDVKNLGVDFYCFSWYKLFGPHVATLYASKQVQSCLRSIGHEFRSTDSLEGLLSLAAASYELVSSIPQVANYIKNTSWDHVSKYEETLQTILIDYLNSKPDQIQIWGQPVADSNKRVPVISFTVKGRSSQDIVEKIQTKSNFGCKWGSFLSVRLCTEILGLDMDDGVIRVSMAHYNTVNEIEGFVKILDEAI